jgi:D-alanyl-D-alanine carboxypeptidase
MKRRHSIAAKALTFSLFLFPGCAPAKDITTDASCPAPPQEMDARLEAMIDPIVDSALERGFAGGVTVMKDGAVIYDRLAGSASLDENIPVTDETFFQVASIAKYYTAAMVMKAVEEGRFSLSDNIGVLAPDTKTAARGVTFLDLLSHASGLQSTYVAEAETQRDAALTAIDNTHVNEKSVGGFKYSNDGYDLLGVLLERAYDRPYEEILQEKIIEPSCLRHTSHWSLADLGDPRIVSQPLNGFPESLRHRNYGMMASAGLLTTAADLALYETALFGGKIVSRESLDEMIAPRGETRIGRATFGAFLEQETPLGPRLSARGSEDWGDNAIMNHYLDRGIIVAVVTSRGPAEDSGAPMFRNEISEAIEEVLAETGGGE